MNKQESIKKYEDLFETLHVFPVVAIRRVLEDLRQLDEPQKVTIPQFVADWIEEGRKHCEDVSDLFGFDFTNEEVGNWFLREKPFDLVARAWLDGYTVEKEKRYLVKIKNVYNHSSMLKLDSITGRWFFGSEKYMCGSSEKYTRKELEQAGLGWVFDCPGIEIEEVQDDSKI